MSLTPRQLRAIRRRRQDDEAEAEARFQHDVAGPLLGVTDDDDATFFPPVLPVGWIEAGQVGGGFLYCIDCIPSRPTPQHVLCLRESLYATRPCVICGRRLDTVLR